jgi:hypothetical protein
MKSALASLLLSCAAPSLLSQAVVNFRNENLSSPPDRLVRCLDGPMIGTNFAAQLLYGADPVSLTPHPTPAYFRASLSGGTWSGGNRTLPAGVGGVGTTIWLQVRFWDSGDRTRTFDQVRPGDIWGFSQVFSYQQRASSPPDVYDTAMLNFKGFTILSAMCVPEPATAPLLLPAVTLVWLLKRRRSK